MLIDKVTVATTTERSEWPFTLPAVEWIAKHGSSITASITVLVGESGTGK